MRFNMLPSQTIHYGFDRFIIASVQSGNRVVGATQAPSTATTVGDVTTVNPGFITLINRPNYTLTITMFRTGDPMPTKRWMRNRC